MTEHPDHPPIRGRVVYYTILDGGDDGTEVMVEHVWSPGTEPCGDCGKPRHDPGMVGLNVGDEHVLLDAAEALVLANRITRAANLVLELAEDAPDIDRDMARFATAAGAEAPDA
jgi:hypothetical protein